jgi:Fe2+ transport system protein FeoA
MTLWMLPEHQSAKVLGFTDLLPEEYRQRLREIGFEKETEVLCLRSTPFAGPKVFQIGDSVFSLARDLAEMVTLEERSEK